MFNSFFARARSWSTIQKIIFTFWFLFNIGILFSVDFTRSDDLGGIFWFLVISSAIAYIMFRIWAPKSS